MLEISFTFNVQGYEAMGQYLEHRLLREVMTLRSCAEQILRSH